MAEKPAHLRGDDSKKRKLDSAEPPGKRRKVEKSEETTAESDKQKAQSNQTMNGRSMLNFFHLIGKLKVT